MRVYKKKVARGGGGTREGGAGHQGLAPTRLTGRCLGFGTLRAGLGLPDPLSSESCSVPGWEQVDRPHSTPHGLTGKTLLTRFVLGMRFDGKQKESKIHNTSVILWLHSEG